MEVRDGVCLCSALVSLVGDKSWTFWETRLSALRCDLSRRRYELKLLASLQPTCFWKWQLEQQC